MALTETCEPEESPRGGEWLEAHYHGKPPKLSLRDAILARTQAAAYGSPDERWRLYRSEVAL